MKLVTTLGLRTMFSFPMVVPLLLSLPSLLHCVSLQTLVFSLKHAKLIFGCWKLFCNVWCGGAFACVCVQGGAWVFWCSCRVVFACLKMHNALVAQIKTGLKRWWTRQETAMFFYICLLVSVCFFFLVLLTSFFKFLYCPFGLISPFLWCHSKN